MKPMTTDEAVISSYILIAMIRLFFKYEFKDDGNAANVVSAISNRSFTAEGVRKRIKSNFYKKGRDYTQCGTLRLWKREALIKRELEHLKRLKDETIQ